jgi:hypothetical protein
MVKVRKRRAGGGRKPKGPITGKSVWFSTRIAPGTRQALEQFAAATGESISQAAERLLIYGLEERQWRDNHKALRALCFVIERIAFEAAGSRWKDPDDAIFDKSAAHAKVGQRLFNEWRTDPFRCRAFRLAVTSLLSAIEPRGQIRSPHAAEDIDDASAHDPRIDDPHIIELMKRTYESPENFAAYIFSNIWRELNRDYPISESEKQRVGYGRGVTGGLMLADFYHMADARRDLGLDAKGETS